MAVARIAADRRWLRAAAGRIGRTEPRAARELLRAVERRDRVAELTSDEVRALALALPDDERVRVALAAVEESEVRDRARLARHREIATRRHPKDSR